MSKIYISKDANIRLKEYLEALGYTLEFVASDGIVDKAISNHPDTFLCKMGIETDSPIFFAATEDLGKDYPFPDQRKAASGRQRNGHDPRRRTSGLYQMQHGYRRRNLYHHL